jgi:hypothetical protein
MADTTYVIKAARKFVTDADSQTVILEDFQELEVALKAYDAEALHSPRVRTVADLIECLQNWPSEARVSLVNSFTNRYQDIKMVGINRERDHVMLCYVEIQK